jgi:hypothetical protein
MIQDAESYNFVVFQMAVRCYFAIIVTSEWKWVFIEIEVGCTRREIHWNTYLIPW